MSATISTDIVRARKAHICSWHPYKADEHGNEHSIEPGELYERAANVGDDGPYTWKSCAYHRAAANAVFRLSFDDELTAADLTDWMYEWWSEATRAAEVGVPYPMPFNAHEELQP